MKKLFRAQSTLEFMMIIILVLAGIFVMGPYVIRSVNAYLHSWEVSSEQARNQPADILSYNPHALFLCEFVDCQSRMSEWDCSGKAVNFNTEDAGCCVWIQPYYCVGTDCVINSSVSSKNCYNEYLASSMCTGGEEEWPLPGSTELVLVKCDNKKPCVDAACLVPSGGCESVDCTTKSTVTDECYKWSQLGCCCLSRAGSCTNMGCAVNLVCQQGAPGPQPPGDGFKCADWSHCPAGCEGCCP